MKNKKLLIFIISPIAVVVTAIILAFTLFGLNKVEINLKNDSTKFSSSVSQEKVIDSGSFSKNSCVFFINKQNHTELLEKNNPYLKVINIETKFPNKLIIHCIEREELFALKVNDSKYFIVDSEFKLLNVIGEFESDSNNAILLGGEINIENKDAELGEFISLGDEHDNIKNIYTSLFLNNRTPAEQKALFKEISIEYNLVSKPHLNIKDYNGLNICIKYMRDKLPQKLQCLFATYNQIDISDYNDATLTIQENENNEIIAVFSKE